MRFMQDCEKIRIPQLIVMNYKSLTKEAQKEKKMALKKEKETKLFEFLTAEQQARYKEIMEKKKKDGEQ